MKDRFFGTMEILGLWSAILMVAVILELKTIVKQTESVPIGKLVFETGFTPYIVGLISWTILLLAVGFLWSQILFPKRPKREKAIFSLVAGCVVMAFSIASAFFVSVVMSIIAALFGVGTKPPYAEYLFKEHINVIVSNQEQTYQLAIILLFAVIGGVILGLKQLAANKETAPQQTV